MMLSIENARRKLAIALVVLALGSAPAIADAGEADVIAVKVTRSSGGTYDFDVTVRSKDTGWTYYADALEVWMPDGRTLLKRRVLLHPHDDEQPFTRDVYGVAVPPGIDRVLVRARLKPKGYDGDAVTVELPR